MFYTLILDVVHDNDSIRPHLRNLRFLKLFPARYPTLQAAGYGMNQEEFRDKLGSEIVIEHAKGHFSGARDNTKEVPVILESLLKMAK